MTQYVQNPPKVEAVQWDGTLDGAKVIQAFLSKYGRNASFHIKVFFHAHELEARMRDYLEFEGPIPGTQNRDADRFYSGYWLVRYPDEKLQLIDDERFKREFQEVYEDDGAQNTT